MNRGNLFAIAGLLAIAGVLCLWLGSSLSGGGDIRSHIAETYPRDSRATGDLYVCEDLPANVVADLVAYLEPEAQATDRGATYLRYEDDIVIVGPEGVFPCTVRVEDLGARYSSGGFLFLGTGFFPGSPAGGSGGTPGGPDGPK